MQACEYKKSELDSIESFIFAFIWSKNCLVVKAPDRIKREILKLDYKEGGLRAPDINILNASLKLKQFLKASGSGHVIKKLQVWMLEEVGYDYPILQEYDKITNYENVVAVAQKTINDLTNITRSEIDKVEDIGSIPEYKINLIASTDVRRFLLKKNKFLLVSFYEELFGSGIETFKKLVIEALFPRNDRFGEKAKLVTKGFPPRWMQIIQNNITANDSID